MKIYHMQNTLDRRAEKQGMPVKLSGLKKAAGAEDIVTLTARAQESFKRDNVIRLREQELRKLAMRHINDSNGVLEGIENDEEFLKAEKLALLAELVIRVSPSGARKKIYSRVTDFVVDQLSQGS